MEIALFLVLGFVAYMYDSAERTRTALHRTFSALLAAESAEAFRERLQLARRQGEQISARLLIPLLLLFALILVLLMVPAFFSL